MSYFSTAVKNAVTKDNLRKGEFILAYSLEDTESTSVRKCGCKWQAWQQGKEAEKSIFGWKHRRETETSRRVRFYNLKANPAPSKEGCTI